MPDEITSLRNEISRLKKLLASYSQMQIEYNKNKVELILLREENKRLVAENEQNLKWIVEK